MEKQKTWIPTKEGGAWARSGLDHLPIFESTLWAQEGMEELMAAAIANARESPDIRTGSEPEPPHQETSPKERAVRTRTTPPKPTPKPPFSGTWIV